ncbi:MAG: hypothetical protein Greene071421_311 [Parcubacteria group bacterium Greene0714_21]|nr:MAG: hypothetical protein Greene041639_129 [Parcubacteria group bacterium Greene0416_39]TSC97191.1 MAG: hypothetical protein Greene101447_582 [Parcubacteria group bacterium Greene1014_47]TSD04149.1 MAG: hypothetical protein Greene071421_311 [Parcubacteria group bacterium Greene0714_21]
MEPITLVPGFVLRDRRSVTVIDEHISIMSAPGRFRQSVAAHDGCNGIVDVVIDADDYNVLRCRKCGKDVKLPKDITTYVELRAWAQQAAGSTV